MEEHDRGSIEPRLGSIRGGIAAIRVEGDRRTTRTMIMAQSRRDRGPIVGLFEAEIKADLARN